MCVYLHMCEMGGRQCRWVLRVLSVERCVAYCVAVYGVYACVDMCLCKGCGVYGGP
jgi:hypothetical protein